MKRSRNAPSSSGKVPQLEQRLHVKLRSTPRSSAPVPLPAAAASGNAALGDHLEEIERDALVKALEKTRYNKTAAAKLLGMTFRALRYRIKKLGIE